MSFLGEQIRAIRTKQNLTQQDFAARLSISTQYLCDIEHGRRRLSLKTIRALAQTSPEPKFAERLIAAWLLDSGVTAAELESSVRCARSLTYLRNKANKGQTSCR